ncbi:hypothetical protein CEE35_07620 [Candidatus Aerophobetes bacterium Ae_b3b]|nr:MAG: hypothetical protein CEE35_07620 [Candidatus Aerophobetes bacterium Ae_b3b]
MILRIIAFTMILCLSLGTFSLANQKSTSNLPTLKWERSIKTRMFLGIVLGLAGGVVAATNKEKDIKGDNAALGVALVGFGYALLNWVKLYSAAESKQEYWDEVDEVWEYTEGKHAVLIEAEDNTKFDSLDAIKKEIEKRKKNWEELVAQEWGVPIIHTEPGFGDLNLREHLGLWDAQAIIFTPFRTTLSTLSMLRKAFGDEKVREEFEKVRGDLRELEKVKELEKPTPLYLGFVIRIPTYQWELPFLNYLALLRYDGNELEPIFSHERESKVYYDHKVRYDEMYKEKREFTELGLGLTDSIATFLYFDFAIEDRDFNPQGKVELYLLTERGTEGVFVFDLSKMR